MYLRISASVSINSRLISNFGPRLTAHFQTNTRWTWHVTCAYKDSNGCDFRDEKPQRPPGDPHQSHVRLLTRHCTPSYARPTCSHLSRNEKPPFIRSRVPIDCRYFGRISCYPDFYCHPKEHR